jgi:hypothetical protein
VLTLHVFPGGRASAHGAVLTVLHRDAPPDALVVQGATAACADTNNDGIAGFAGASILFRDDSGRGDFQGTLVPDGGDIGASGRHTGTLRLGDGSEPIAVEIVMRWPKGVRPVRPPR